MLPPYVMFSKGQLQYFLPLPELESDILQRCLRVSQSNSDTLMNVYWDVSLYFSRQ